MTPEATVSIAVAAVIALAALLLMRRRFRWAVLMMALVLLIADGGVWWVITPHRYDVTRLPRFRNIVEPAWCFNTDFFLVDQSPDLPSLEMAGSSSAVPTSVADYRAHPMDWSKSPDYQRIYGTLPFAPQSTILGVLPARTPFRVENVIAEYRPRTRDVIILANVKIAGRVADGSMLFYDAPNHSLVPGQNLNRCSE